MAIKIFFGLPTTVDREEEISEWAIEKNLPYEKAVNDWFRKILSYSLQEEEGSCFFKSLIQEKLSKRIELPKIRFQMYVERGNKLPLILIEEEYVIGLKSRQPFFISDTLGEHIGKGFEKYYDYEYIGMKRV